jgi:hypothetical protein
MISQPANRQSYSAWKVCSGNGYRPAGLQIFRAWHTFLKEGVADDETKT